MVAGTLKGVISQRLVRAKDGGRVATCEVMRMTGRVRDFIMDPSQTGKLGEVIADGGFYGMQTFDQALFTHVKDGRHQRRGGGPRRDEPARLQAAARGGRSPRHDDGRRRGHPRGCLTPRDFTK